MSDKLIEKHVCFRWQSDVLPWKIVVLIFFSKFQPRFQGIYSYYKESRSGDEVAKVFLLLQALLIESVVRTLSYGNLSLNHNSK